MRRESFICNVCAAERKEVNHWFVAFISANSGTVHINTWSEMRAREPGAFHLCGAACVHKFVDSFLSGVSK